MMPEFVTLPVRRPGLLAARESMTDSLSHGIYRNSIRCCDDMSLEWYREVPCINGHNTVNFEQRQFTSFYNKRQNTHLGFQFLSRCAPYSLVRAVVTPGTRNQSQKKARLAPARDELL